ncbi:MAG: hypothetical protein JWR67_3069 [Mucilaginibacter sp.]|nr:hypothetical protein [Mucilaginibacter sp.]
MKLLIFYLITIVNLLNYKTMTKQDYTITLLVGQSPEQVFRAIGKPRGWWSEQIEGPTDELNAEFSYHYKDIHRCKIKITEFVPGKKVVWLVLENHFDFTKDKTEWKGTKMVFEISKKDGKTQLVFTHVGLVPAYECYELCSDAWGNYIGKSLKSLIETGKGQPNPYIPAIEGAEILKSKQYEHE